MWKPENFGFMSMTNPASRIIFGLPPALFMTAMWWSAIVLKPDVKTHIEGHIFQQST
jgi:hypothetical protein